MTRHGIETLYQASIMSMCDKLGKWDIIKMSSLDFGKINR